MGLFTWLTKLWRRIRYEEIIPWELYPPFKREMLERIANFLPPDYASRYREKLQRSQSEPVAILRPSLFGSPALPDWWSKEEAVILNEPSGAPRKAIDWRSFKHNELHVARAYIKCTHSEGRFRCDVWSIDQDSLFPCVLVWNRVTNELYSSPYQCQLATLEPGSYVANLLNMPAEPLHYSPATEERVCSFLEGIGDIALEPPASESERSAFVRLWGFLLPEDYVALLDKTNGFELHGWRFYGTRPRTVVVEQNLLVLAENQEEGVLASVEDECENFLGLRYESFEHEVRELPGSFIEAFRECARI
jgi:hypothetical protein